MAFPKSDGLLKLWLDLFIKHTHSDQTHHLYAPLVGHLLLEVGRSRRSNKTRERCCGYLVVACFVQWKYTIFPEDGPINPTIFVVCLTGAFGG